MKRFIVTGGYGFIGSNLIRLLIKKNGNIATINIVKQYPGWNKFIEEPTPLASYAAVGINDPHKYIRYKYGNEKIKNKNIE